MNTLRIDPVNININQNVLSINIEPGADCLEISAFSTKNDDGHHLIFLRFSYVYIFLCALVV